MTGNVAKTSKDAYREIKESGQDITDKKRCKKIIEKYGPITMEEMELHMGKRKNAFSGRVRELKDDKTVEVTGTKNGHQVLELTEQSDVEKEWVSDPSEVDLIDSSEDLGLFEDDNQSDEPKAGDVIYG